MITRSITIAMICVLAVVATGCVVAPYRDDGRYYYDYDRHDRRAPDGWNGWRGHHRHRHH